MKTLPITLFLLMLLAVLTYGSFTTGLDRLIELKAAQGALEAQRAAHNTWQEMVYLTRKGKRLESRPRPPKPRLTLPQKSEKKRLPKPPPLILPTKLNLAQALKRSEQGKLYRAAIETLISNLYGDCPPELFDRLGAALKGQKAPLPESLATLDLGDLQPLWQMMLLGDGSPSLLDYLYYRPTQNTPSINIAWAPRPLLEVLFPNSPKIDHLILLQENMAAKELKSEDLSPLLEAYRDTVNLRDSPYQKILILSLLGEKGPATLTVHDVEGQAEGASGPSQMSTQVKLGL